MMELSNWFSDDQKASGIFQRLGHIHVSRHDGFHIIMQTSHVFCHGANIEMMPFLGKSARRNSDLAAPNDI